MSIQAELSQGPFKLINYYSRPSLDVPWFETDQETKNHIKSQYEDLGCVFVKYEFNNGLEKVIEVHLKNYDLMIHYLLDTGLAESRTLRKSYDFENDIVNTRRELMDIPNNRNIADLIFFKNLNNMYVLNYESLGL